MKRLTKFIYAIIIFIVAVTISLVIGIYALVTDRAVKNAMVDNIREIVSHDRNSITMFVQFNWANLKRIGGRLKRRADELTDVRRINEYLSYEAYESNFDKVFVLMEDGSYYTDITYRKDETTTDFYPLKDMFSGADNKVIGFGSLPVMGSEMSIIYGYRLTENDLTGIRIGEDGMAVSAIIGICKRSTIGEGLVIESFIGESGEVRGYSSLINIDGDYIVDRHNTASFDVDNLFDFISESDSSDLSADEVKEKMLRGETFWFYQEKEGKRELQYCSPLSEDIGWYFLLSVDNVALKEQTAVFIEMVAVAFTVIILVSLIAMVIVIIMQRKAAKAYAQEKAQSDFLSNMSHEIRTPLNGIIGLNYLMLTAIDDPNKTEQVKEWLNKSHGTAKYLLSLINDILDVSKLRAGKVDIHREPLLIDSIVDSMHSMQYENISSRGIEYATDVNITCPCILGDNVRIKQVLMNIIGNAAKFTPTGGKITFSVSQTQTDEKHVTTFFVCEDTGCGMSKEFLSKIFDKFEQERNSSSNATKGTGLGMAISKLLIDAMGGDIKVESELGKGTKITVILPAEISDIPDYLDYKVDAGAEKIAEKNSENFKQLKVLVAEDNELNAEILMDILQDAGFSVEHAENGEIAVQKFFASEAGEYGLILMDMRMPVLDGCSAAERIRKLDRPDAATIPIIACTANSFQEDRIRVLESGMNDMITKPVDVKVLLQKIEFINSGKNSDGSSKEEK